MERFSNPLDLFHMSVWPIKSAWKGETIGSTLDKPSAFHTQSRPIRFFFSCLMSQLWALGLLLVRWPAKSITTPRWAVMCLSVLPNSCQSQSGAKREHLLPQRKALSAVLPKILVASSSSSSSWSYICLVLLGGAAGGSHLLLLSQPKGHWMVAQDYERLF